MTMKTICTYFQVHQPVRLRRIKTFERADGYDYWDHAKNREIFDRASDKCYLPANRLILDAIERSAGAFRVAYSVSGTFLEQAEQFRPDVLDSFAELAQTGCVEFLQETYYHSLAGLWDTPDEFERQVAEHRQATKRLLGVAPRVFRNTELIFDDRIAGRVADMGYAGILAEGTEKILGARNPNHVYESKGGLPMLLKNYRLSDDVAFRFSARDWPGWPLTAPTYAKWLADAPGETVNLFMDYETLGEHQWRETGIFDFLWHLPGEVAKHPDLCFATPSEVLATHPSRGKVEAPWAVSWADTERDVSAWLGNKMQHHAFNRLRSMEEAVVRSDHAEASHAWRLLQTSDHLYYESTKNMADGQIHAYFSPYDSPYLAYINHLNALEDLREKVARLPVRPDVQIRESRRPADGPLAPEPPLAEAQSDRLVH